VQVRDIIISYDHQDVATFDDLEKLIARNKVGDTVEIEVARGGEALILAMSRRPLQDLGLAGDPTAIGVKITQVEPKQGAASAGLRVGDIVASVDDERISTLEEP
jgi:S1-C subfamily serine protease